jgi:hypothetical protein|tara:strand:+ start:185 stop:442 length:258 start_codon:yes stop_codon:yes gene_type:complete
MDISNKRYITIQQDDATKELYIEIPKELEDWKEGDEIEFTCFQEDKAIIIKNTRIAKQKSKHPYDIKQEEIQYYLDQEVYQEWTW